MPPAARIGDMHFCPIVTPGVPPIPHVGGPILPPGCPTVLICGMPAARVGDMATCVGPPDVIAMGSMTVFIGGMPAARLGDMTVHGGVIAMGCPSVLIGDAGGGGGAGARGASATPDTPAPSPASVVAATAVIQAWAQEGTTQVGEVPGEQMGPLRPQEGEKPKTWIGIKLKDFDGTPMPDQDFQVTLEGGQLLKGKTDQEGYCRFDDIDPDQGEVAFTQIPEQHEIIAGSEAEPAREENEADRLRLPGTSPPPEPDEDEMVEVEPSELLELDDEE